MVKLFGEEDDLRGFCELGWSELLWMGFLGAFLFFLGGGKEGEEESSFCPEGNPEFGGESSHESSAKGFTSLGGLGVKRSSLKATYRDSPIRITANTREAVKKIFSPLENPK